MSDGPDPIDEWAERLRSEVVTPVADEAVSGIAAAAAATTAAGVAGAGAAAAVAAHTAAKVAAAVVLSAVLAGGAAAATGILPDPIQSWIADVVEHVGIHLPRPDLGRLPDVPIPTVPDVGGTVSSVTSLVPDVTLPPLPLPTEPPAGG